MFGKQKPVAQPFQDLPRILGAKVRDKISGFEGIATGYHIYLTGCNRVSVSPKVTADMKLPDGGIFDESQLEVLELAEKPKEPTTRGGPPTVMPRRGL